MVTASPVFQVRFTRAKVFGAGVESNLPLTSMIVPFAQPGMRSSKGAESGEAGLRIIRTVLRKGY